MYRPMMKVVVLVSLEVILPATMGSSGRDKQVDSVPHERERGCKDKQGRSDTTAEVYGLYTMLYTYTIYKYVC